MSEKIEPAVSPEIWKQVAGSPWPIDSYIGDTPEVCAYLIALNNHTLPDSDPRKITRRMIAEMEACADEADSQTLHDYAMALAAFLPPE